MNNYPDIYFIQTPKINNEYNEYINLKKNILENENNNLLTHEIILDFNNTNTTKIKKLDRVEYGFCTGQNNNNKQIRFFNDNYYDNWGFQFFNSNDNLEIWSNTEKTSFINIFLNTIDIRYNFIIKILGITEYETMI